MIFFVGVVVLVSSCFAALLMWPRTSFTDAMGLVELQARTKAIAQFMYWSAVAVVKDDTSQTSVTIYGSIEKIDPQRNILLVNVPVGETWVKASYQLADAVINDAGIANSIIEGLPTRDARLEVYQGTHALVYVDGQPLHIRLIEAGAATINPNPPSNIVSKAFAAYYLRIAKGVKQNIN